MKIIVSEDQRSQTENVTEQLHYQRTGAQYTRTRTHKQQYYLSGKQQCQL